MVQDQLTDYISSQMKLGVSRDAIKSALVSAGWVAGDVEDTLKKAEGSAMPGAMATTKPAMQPQTSTTASMQTGGAKSAQTMSTGSASPFFSATSAGSTKASDPQVVKVSDPVSGSVSGANFGGKIKGDTFEASPSVMASSMKNGGGISSGSGKGSSMLIMEIVGGVVILALIGLCFYLYSENGSLSAKAATLTTQSAQVSSQLTALQSQMDASNTGIEAQLASLTAANTDLALNLSFYAVPLGAANATSSLPVTISGSLGGGGKAPYAITTPRGSKIYIANSADAQIAAQLKPLLTQTIELTGTYMQGSDEMTVVSIANVSGTTAPVAGAAATSTAMTATSTASSTAN